MRRKPIEVIIGWKATFGWLNYTAQAWVAFPKPKRRLLHVNMGWTAFGQFERAMNRNALPFGTRAILADVSTDAHRRLADATIMVDVYALSRDLWRP